MSDASHPSTAAGEAVQLVQLDGNVYRVSSRTLVAIEHAGPKEGRGVLLAKGYLVGTPVQFEALQFQAEPASPGKRGRLGALGRPPGTGRFENRDELLERAWFFKDSTNLSEAAIARNLGIGAGTLARIYQSGEGRPNKEKATHDEIVGG